MYHQLWGTKFSHQFRCLMEKHIWYFWNVNLYIRKQTWAYGKDISLNNFLGNLTLKKAICIYVNMYIHMCVVHVYVYRYICVYVYISYRNILKQLTSLWSNKVALQVATTASKMNNEQVCSLFSCACVCVCVVLPFLNRNASTKLSQLQWKCVYFH